MSAKKINNPKEMMGAIVVIVVTEMNRENHVVTVCVLCCDFSGI